MRAILLAALMGVSASALADIKIPNKDVASTTYTGAAAQDKFNAIAGKPIPEWSSGWTGEAVSYKVERATDGLEQTFCRHHTNYRNSQVPATYTCTYDKSLNGQPVPVFVPHHHLG